MDVAKATLAVALTLVFAACSNQKTVDSVYNNSTQGTSQCAGQAVSNRFIVQWEDGSFSVESGENSDQFKDKFIRPNLEQIRKVENDRMIQVHPLSAQETPLVGSALAPDAWGQQIIGAQNVWSQSIDGTGVLVGVVDSTVDINHVQLSSQISLNKAEIPNNGFDDDRNGYIDDYFGQSFISQPGTNTQMNPHGSHVSGIIAADPTKGPIHGVAPGAKIIPAPFISNDGSGSLGDAVLALQYVAQRGARVVNASWGGAPCVSSLQNVFLELQKKGVLIVVAAGNDGHDLDIYPTYPAAFNASNQITVAASTIDDFMSSWSNSSFNLVHLAAPGAHILSTIPNNSTAYFDGTSMAAPFVTGAAAILMSVRPQANYQQVKTALLNSVDVIANHEYKVTTHGRLNLQKAVDEIKRIAP